MVGMTLLVARLNQRHNHRPWEFLLRIRLDFACILVIQETYGKVIICFDQIEENRTAIDVFNVFGVWLNCIFVPAFYRKQMLLG